MKTVLTLAKDLIVGGIIGIANIIPGVSGGTMALVLGIYERLIDAIHNINGKTIKTLFKVVTLKKENIEGFKEESKRIDLVFLIKITVGALLAIVALAKLMTYLLKSHHDPTYGFFFGLVLVSIVAPIKLIKKISLPTIITGILAVILVIGVAESIYTNNKLPGTQKKYEQKYQDKIKKQNNTLKASKTKKSIKIYIYMIFLGAVAISAMILPGVSGSFLMLLMGGYFDILKAISNRDLPILAVFAIGCLLGVALFSRLLNFLLKKWNDQTMSFLAGLVLGSLWMIWPFKISKTIGDKTIDLANALPASFAKNEAITLIAILAGILIVGAMLAIENKNKEKA